MIATHRNRKSGAQVTYLREWSGRAEFREGSKLRRMVVDKFSRDYEALATEAPPLPAPRVLVRPVEYKPRAPVAPIAKDIPHRDRAFLDLAHDLNNCTMRIPGVCLGFSLHGCEPAHAGAWHPVFGKSGARKAHDIFHAAACHNCHAELDQGRKLTAEQRYETWQAAFNETMREYATRGWIKVAA